MVADSLIFRPRELIQSTPWQAAPLFFVFYAKICARAVLSQRAGKLSPISYDLLRR